jgi:hypothetical protein
MSRRLRIVAALAVAAQASTAHADATVDVTLNAEGNKLAQRLGLSVPDLIAQYEAKIDELYKVTGLPGLLTSFGNTASFAQRGLGVDYDTDTGDILVGFTAAGVHGDVAIGTTNELLGGSVLNYQLMTGVNLARWNHPRWTVFGNGFYKTTHIRGLVGHLLTLGSHVQYQAVPRTQPSSARWTGVAVTTGLEHSRWTIGTESSIESHFTAHGTSEDITIHMSSTGTLDVLSSITTIPVEVSTGVRLGSIVVAYAGGGVDLTLGTSSVTAQLDSVLSYTGDQIPVGNAVIVGSGENGPSTLTVHAIGGLAIHTRHVRVIMQGMIAPGELGVNLGLRAAI